MKLCTETGAIQSRLGELEGIEALAAAGFDSLDYSLNKYPTDGILSKSDTEIRDYFAKLRGFIESRGIYVNQTHTHYPTRLEPDYYELTRCELLASVALGARFAVIHPVKLPGEPRERVKAVNVEFYSSLVPIIADSELKIGVENMFTTDRATRKILPSVCSTADELADYVDTLNSLAPGRFAACLDLGHANLVGGEPVAAMIRRLGSRVELLHVHDNDGIRDRHSAPGFGNIDWSEVCAALSEVGYSGDFSFESHGFFKAFDEVLLTDAAAMLAKIGRSFIEKYRL